MKEMSKITDLVSYMHKYVQKPLNDKTISNFKDAKLQITYKEEPVFLTARIVLDIRSYRVQLSHT